MEIRSSIVRFLALAAVLQGCLLGGGSKNNTNIKPKPKPQQLDTPTVVFVEDDSLLHIRIKAKKDGEARHHWIYRDDRLLEYPAYQGPANAAQGWYVLVDTVPRPGEYSYTVQYGPHKDTLSGPSKPYVFRYAGPAPSGRVSLSIGANGMVEIKHRSGREVLRQVIIQRKIGAGGSILALDTLELATGLSASLVDSAMVAANAFFYYRAVGMDLDENWLAPSPWDSILISNKDWTYLPAATLRNTGAEIEATVINPAADAGAISYFLYRNTKSAKEGAAPVTTVTTSGGAQPVLKDVPPKDGTWWYWVVARDGRGRTSARSNPASIVFHGPPKGPAITGISIAADYLYIHFKADPAAAYYVLERAKDTSMVPVRIPMEQPSSFPAYVVDRPPADGYWNYRLISFFPDGGSSEAGAWCRSDFYRTPPILFDLDVTISKVGGRAGFAPNTLVDGITYILYRSSHPSGMDSTPVDTAYYADHLSELPILSDAPGPGTWYYQVRGSVAKGDVTHEYRSVFLKVDFLERPAGPSISGITVYSTHVELRFPGINGSRAYVVERASDLGFPWVTVDSLPAGGAWEIVISTDRPPFNGYWQYRVRCILADNSLGEPGPASRLPLPWRAEIVYSNTLRATINNSGTYVEASGLTMTFQHRHVLYRGVRNDYTAGMAVDTALYGEFPQTLRDLPPRGFHYYWVVREYAGSGAPPDTVYRSVPIQVEFTGKPEVFSVTQQGQAIRIGLPSFGEKDVLEIMRSAGKPEDDLSYEKVAEATGGVGDHFMDRGFDTSKAAFYHYRLYLIRLGNRSQLGGTKSIYYNP